MQVTDNNELINSKKKRDWINAQNILMKPIKVKFDIQTLNMILAFIYKDSVLRNRKNLNYFKKVIDNIDPKVYKDNPLLERRFWVIKKSIEAVNEVGLESFDLIKSYCLDQEDNDELSQSIINEIGKYKISHEESKYLINKICDVLKFGYTVSVKEIFQDLLNKLDDEDFRSYKALEKDLNDIAISTISIHRSAGQLDSEETFALDDDTFAEVVEDSMNKLKDRNRIFVTGIQKLNVLLSPGYMSRRLYLYLAFPGKGKSTMLLKSAIDIKKYNKTVKTKDPSKRPAVLFLTLENDIPETVERMYNMTVDSDDIRNYTTKQVIHKLRKNGSLVVTEDDPIDIIIKEYKNQSITVEDIYGIIDDLSDQGIEVITLIVDYIKRLKPTNPAQSEKEELKNISNELKDLAKTKDICVITAQQLNRSGATIVDAALHANKTDITRLVGRDAIASAWELNSKGSTTLIAGTRESAAKRIVQRLSKRTSFLSRVVNTKRVA